MQFIRHYFQISAYILCFSLISKLNKRQTISYQILDYHLQFSLYINANFDELSAGKGNE